MHGPGWRNIAGRREIMKMPTKDQIEMAIAWLEYNDGDHGESDACGAVAQWLDHLSREDYLRKAARQGGVPLRALRAKLSERAWNEGKYVNPK